MPETRTYQGHTYTRLGPGEPWQRSGPAQGAQPGPITIGQPDPYRPAAENRAEEDQVMERERLRLAQQSAAVTAANANKPPAGFERAADGGLQFIPGGPEDPVIIAERAAAIEAAQGGGTGLTAEARGKLEAQFGGAQALVNRIKEIEDRFAADFEGAGVSALGEYLPGTLRPENQQFEDAGRALMGALASAFGLAAQQQNTPQELEIRFGPFIPKPGDRDDVIRAKITRLKEIARDQGGQALSQLGREDDIAPFVSALGFNDATAPAPPGPAAGFGATEQAVPLDPAYQAEYEAFVRAGDWTPEQYAAKRAELDERFGYVPAADYMAEGHRIRETLNTGGPLNLAIPPISEEMSGLDQLRNDAVSNPLGAFAASMGNAGGFGIPSLLAGDEMDAMREANPVASFMGEIGGGVTGTMLGAGALGGVASRAANPTVAKILANPLTADMGYGAVYGATQADDPLMGAFGGMAGAAVGNIIGSQVAKRVPIAALLRKPADSLSRGERRVVTALGETGTETVQNSLQEAADLGIPASPADFSPELNNLTGAAIRRSPTAAGMARDTLGQRSRGQYDRFNQAIERDLGPIENIPQRSDELIAQARTNARPLYEQAYAAPGAETVNLSDLQDRPTFAAALREAYNEVLDENIDPSAMGLVQEGENILVGSPSWQALDYVKRGLDNIIERGTSKIDGVGPEARRAIEMKNILVSRMDEANPTYAQARAAYAGPAAERAGLERGQRAIRTSPDQLQVNVANSSPEQAGQMRLGFQSQVAENAGRLRNNSNPFGQIDNPAMEARLGTLYDPPNVARLLRQRDLEGELAGSTNRLIGNSLTAERQLADQAFSQGSLMGDVVQGGIETAVMGAPVATALRSSIGRGAGQAMRDWRTLGFGRRATEMADEIAPIALNTDTPVAMEQIQELMSRGMEFEKALATLQARAANRGRLAGVGVATALNAGLQR